MTEHAQSAQQTERNSSLENLSNEERQFVQKANNAGLAVSFTPQGSSERLTFFPSETQIRNSENSRSLSSNPEEGLPYATLLKEKQQHQGIGIISEEEAEQVPYMHNMLQSFFSTLSPETKRFVLRANLSGLNITAKGNNGKSFLYLAPQNDQARALMRQELAQIETQPQNPLRNTERVSTTSTPAPLAINNTIQHQ